MTKAPNLFPKCPRETKFLKNKTPTRAESINYLSGKVLQDCGEVDRGPSTDPLRVLPGLQEPRDTTDGELEPGLAASRRPLLRRRRSYGLPSSRHFF